MSDSGSPLLYEPSLSPEISIGHLLSVLLMNLLEVYEYCSHTAFCLGPGLTL